MSSLGDVPIASGLVIEAGAQVSEALAYGLDGWRGVLDVGLQFPSQGVKLPDELRQPRASYAAPHRRGLYAGPLERLVGALEVASTHEPVSLVEQALQLFMIFGTTSSYSVLQERLPSMLFSTLPDALQLCVILRPSDSTIA
jgi:hypothetical protein